MARFEGFDLGFEASYIRWMAVETKSMSRVCCCNGRYISVISDIGYARFDPKWPRGDFRP